MELYPVLENNNNKCFASLDIFYNKSKKVKIIVNCICLSIKSSNDPPSYPLK